MLQVLPLKLHVQKKEKVEMHKKIFLPRTLRSSIYSFTFANCYAPPFIIQHSYNVLILHATFLNAIAHCSTSNVRDTTMFILPLVVLKIMFTLHIQCTCIQQPPATNAQHICKLLPHVNKQETRPKFAPRPSPLSLCPSPFAPLPLPLAFHPLPFAPHPSPTCYVFFSCLLEDLSYSNANLGPWLCLAHYV